MSNPRLHPSRVAEHLFSYNGHATVTSYTDKDALSDDSVLFFVSARRSGARRRRGSRFGTGATSSGIGAISNKMFERPHEPQPVETPGWGACKAECN